VAAGLQACGTTASISRVTCCRRDWYRGNEKDSGFVGANLFGREAKMKTTAASPRKHHQHGIIFDETFVDFAER
jgi:hypothetical protein